MARFQVLSDLHLNHWADHGESFFKSLKPSNEDQIDALILAGDIDGIDTLYKTLGRFCELYPTVIFVEGNHEYYGSSPDKVFNTLSNISYRLSNLFWLNSETVIIKNIVIAGTTLWFRDDPLNVTYKHLLNDFSLIKKFVPWVYTQNDIAIRFLQSHPPADILITHHIPVPSGIPPEYRNSQLNRFFLCDITKELLDIRPKFCVSGHTHSPTRFEENGIQFVNNAFGYPHEPKKEFIEKLIIEV